MRNVSGDPMIVDLSVRLYRAMVRIYPAAFRSEYGDLMVQVFCDHCLRVSRQSGALGVLALWSWTLPDVLISTIEQYANRGAVMTRSKWIKISGWLLAAGGILFVLGWAATSRPVYHEANAAAWPVDRYLNVVGMPVLLLAMLFTAAGVLGLLARFGRHAGNAGQAGLVLSLAGIGSSIGGVIGMSIRDSGPWWQMLVFGIMALFTGLAVFGVACVRRKLLPIGNSIPLLISLPFPVALLAQILYPAVAGQELLIPDAVLYTVLGVSFLGISLVGYLLQTGDQKLEPTAAV